MNAHVGPSIVLHNKYSWIFDGCNLHFLLYFNSKPIFINQEYRNSLCTYLHDFYISDITAK